MFHWCQDENLLLMSTIPFIGVFFRKVHAWWHLKVNHKCHHKTECNEHHLEHPSTKKPGYLTQEDIDAELKYIKDENFDDKDHR